MNNLLKTKPEIRTKNRGGAPKGNRNALKTGAHTAAMRVRMASWHAVLRRAKQTLAEVKD
jgi:uncharacterized protein YjcR